MPRTNLNDTPSAAASDAAAAARYLPERPLAEPLTAPPVAGPLVGRLLRAPRAERLGIIATDPAYRQAGLARLLALLAEARLDSPLSEAQEYAELALAVSIAAPAGSVESRRLRGHCHWLVGKAELRAGRLAAAEASFAAIATDLGGAGSAAERALAAVGIAQLRWHQRRLPEAWALLSTAARAFADSGHALPAGACLGLAGFLLLASDEPMLARLDLRAAHQLLGRLHAPALGVLICLGLAHCDAVLGGTAAADFLVIAGEAARACGRPAPELGRWWQAVLGLRRDAADPEREAARGDALARRDAAAAARLTLDQAMRRIAAGEGGSVACLAAPLAALGPEGDGWKQEIAALVPLAVARPETYLRAARGLALRLAVPAIAGLGAQGLPWPVCDLADRLLLRRPEGNDPSRALPGL